MRQLVVRNLESDLIHRLKQRAAEQGISAEEEHRRILRRALFGSEEEFPDLKSLLIMPDAATRCRRLSSNAGVTPCKPNSAGLAICCPSRLRRHLSGVA